MITSESPAARSARIAANNASTSCGASTLVAYVRARTEHELADLFEARLELEGRTTALAAERRTADQLAELDDILARQATAEDPLDLARINGEFHIAVATCSQNKLMAGFVQSLSMRARFYFSTVAPDRREESLRDHRAIIEALRRRDGAEAERIGREHIANTRVDVLRTLPSQDPFPAAATEY